LSTSGGTVTGDTTFNGTTNFTGGDGIIVSQRAKFINYPITVANGIAVDRDDEDNSQGTAGQVLTSSGAYQAPTWTTISGYSAPTLGSTSIASGATVTTIAGLTLSGATLTGSLTANSSAGTSGQVLASTGTGVQWVTPAAGAAFSELMLIGA